VNIEELEQMFVPFDITPDMYDIPCDNDDYADFLKTLYAGGGAGEPQNSSLGGGEDDPADPEYRFQPDEEDIQLRDPEELRNDRATKISRKEVLRVNYWRVRSSVVDPGPVGSVYYRLSGILIRIRTGILYTDPDPAT